MFAFNAIEEHLPRPSRILLPAAAGIHGIPDSYLSIYGCDLYTGSIACATSGLTPLELASFQFC